MADVDTLYGDLKDYVHELALKFVDPYIPADPTAIPIDYAHDVKAYCVLAHAAFEEFIEAVVLEVAEHCTGQWILTRKPSNVVTSLLCWHGARIKVDPDENSAETKPFDYLRILVEEAKAAFSKHVFSNHGVSILYLRRLLIPVFIEITTEANLLNSLGKLAEGRGDYAHKGRAKVVLAPEDAKLYVEDVLLLCDDVRMKALLRLS